MDAILDHMLAPLKPWLGAGLLEAATTQFYAFTLVVVRISGLMTIGPLFGQPVVPINVRILLVVALSILVTPTLSLQNEKALARLDADHNQRLTPEEIPDQLFERYAEAARQTGDGLEAGVPLAMFSHRPPLPTTALEYARVILGELALGLVLGLGMFIVLSAFQLAGELIDQQTGTALGEVVKPGLDTTGGATGQLLYLLAVTALLTMTPLAGHLLMVSALVETFQTLPVGQAWVSTPAIELVRDLVHQSLVLGIQVAAPLLAAMSLVALTMGFLGHTVPQINVLVIGFPVRALVNLLLLGLTLTGASRAVVDLVPIVIDRLRYALTGLPG